MIEAGRMMLRGTMVCTWLYLTDLPCNSLNPP